MASAPVPAGPCCAFWIVKVCVVMLAVVAVVTGFFVWAFGHPVAWSVIGVLFAILPLAGLVLAAGVGLRAATAAGPGWLAVRFFGPWRVVDLGQVRALSASSDGGTVPRFRGPAGFGPSGPVVPVVPLVPAWWVRRLWPGGFGPGPAAGPGGASGGAGSGRSAVGPSCSRIFTAGVSRSAWTRLDGLADMVRGGLAPDAVIDVDAARPRAWLWCRRL